MITLRPLVLRLLLVLARLLGRSSLAASLARRPILCGEAVLLLLVALGSLVWCFWQQADLACLREGTEVIGQGPDEVVLLERRKAGALVHRPLAALAAWRRGGRDAKRAPHHRGHRRKTSKFEVASRFHAPSLK